MTQPAWLAVILYRKSTRMSSGFILDKKYMDIRCSIKMRRDLPLKWQNRAFSVFLVKCIGR